MICQGEPLRPIIESGLGYPLPKASTFIGQLHDGQPVCVAGFSTWLGHDVEVSLWSAGRLTRGFLKACGRYAFGDLGCIRVTCRTAGDVPDWHDQLERIGFVREGTLRRGFDGQIDLVIFGLMKEEFRYGQQ